jgi:hypothetical protein
MSCPQLCQLQAALHKKFIEGAVQYYTFVCKNIVSSAIFP